MPGLVQLPYETRLQYLDLYSLSCRRQRGDWKEKIGQPNQVSPDQFFTFVNSTTRGHDQRIYEFNPRLNFFTNQVINQWNSPVNSLIHIGEYLNVNTCFMVRTITSLYEYNMNDGGSYSKLEVAVWITSKPDFTLHCDKAAMQS